MFKLSNAEFVLFDVETTGLSPVDGDRIIELGAAKVRGGEIVDRYATFVNPLRPLNPEAMKTNHITEEMVKSAPTAAEVLPQFVAFTGTACLVAHNASFDIKFLCHELALNNRRMREETPVLDTLKMAREFLPHLTSFRLSYVAHSLGVKVGETHRALADVELLAGVFQKLLLMAGDYNIRDLRELVSRFTVEKPVFRLQRAEEGSLF